MTIQTHILLIFQRVKQFETAATTSNASFSQLGGPSNKAEQISKDEIQKWKQQVLSASRPTNPWYEHQRQSPSISAEYARSPDVRCNVSESSCYSPSRYLPINVATISGENTVFSAANATKSHRAVKSSSLSPLSPVSNNTETSISSLSTGSYGTSSWEKNAAGDAVYHATPYSIDDYISPDSPTKNYYHNGPQERTPTNKHDSTNSTGKVWRQSSVDSPIDKPDLPRYTSTSVVKNINGQVTRVIMNNTATKSTAQTGSYNGIKEQQRLHSNGIAANSGETSRIDVQGQIEPVQQVSPPWRVKSGNKPHKAESAISEQHRKYDEMTEEIQQQLNRNQPALGICGICGNAVTDESQITCALGQLYHQKCFVCDLCGRKLCGKKFYKTRGKTYCEEDYLYSGMHETAERCATCSHLIVDMVLQALGKSYHPRCFRCEKCKTCLDGIPFALDAEGKVYCMEDYHTMFAPKCAACHKPIMPTTESGETVRVVAINKDYHIECYVCEGCGMQLTDEPEKRCYPLNAHLLCKKCHLIWARTGGDKQPITDFDSEVLISSEVSSFSNFHQKEEIPGGKRRQH
uniref:LIM domain-containing protein n=1 Tax=Ascaris lumbricoides TaxID=6252 RepID=A0A0M3HTH2_ASCLU